MIIINIYNTSIGYDRFHTYNYQAINYDENVKTERELNLTVKYVTFNHYYMSSNLIALITIYKKFF